jgi:hypothetical protein
LLQSHVDAPTPAPAADDDGDDDDDGGGGGPSRSGRRARASDAVSPGAAPPPRWRDGASFAPPLPPGAIPVAVDAPAVVPAVAVVAAAGGMKEGGDAGSLLPPGPNSVGIGSRVCGARFIYSL